MFNFGKKKLERERQLQEQMELEKKEREIQAKIDIKRKLNGLRRQVTKLDALKNKYIGDARNAMLQGDSVNCKIAKSALKICMNKQRVFQQMLTQFELSMQLTDINKVVADFVEGMTMISEDMKAITANVNLTKAQEAYERAMAQNQGQFEALDMFLESATESISELEGTESSVSDAEIDALISNGASDEVSNIDAEIDSKIQDLEKKLQGGR